MMQPAGLTLTLLAVLTGFARAQDEVPCAPVPDCGCASASATPALATYGLTDTVIVGRRLFYNNCRYDGNNPGINLSTGPGTDSAAIDNGCYLWGIVYPAKAPLMAGGGTSTFANYSGYMKGLNGLIYDVQNPTPRDPQLQDFTFLNIGKAGTGSGYIVTPSNFATFEISTSPRTVRAVITFADNSVKNTWLQVSVGTGFGVQAETHWWGNVAGATGKGQKCPDLVVGPTDELATRNRPTTVLNPSAVCDPFDVNKDSLVNAGDQLLIRSNRTTVLNCVKCIVR